jgi:hypothetical protein
VTTKQINRLRKTPGGRVWQDDYWDRVIRDPAELNNVRRYIVDNVVNWSNDDLNV